MKYRKNHEGSYTSETGYTICRDIYHRTCWLVLNRGREMAKFWSLKDAKLYVESL